MFYYRWIILCITNLILYTCFVGALDSKDLTFPDGFLIGTATSSHQIEGAWNVGGKGINSWDYFTHNNPNRIFDGNNGDVACDSYHKFKEDVQLIKQTGFNFYRFSVSWSRILPTGYSNHINLEGVKYYHALLDELEKNNITPLMTIYHWDHPQILQDLGGWTNEIMVEHFAEYARIIFKEFGRRVKIFVTINEPNVLCRQGYLTGAKAPGLKLGKYGQYLCTHNMLKAHARAYHIYEQEFRAQQQGKVGIVISCEFYYPKHKNDSYPVEVAYQFDCGMYAAPIFSKTGDYPRIVKERIAKNSKFEGLPKSRLPVFSKYWIEYIKGSSDFFGLNHYSTYLAEFAPKPNDTIYLEDHGILRSLDPKWPTTPASFIFIVPEALKDLLVKINKEYENPSVFITENGIADFGTIKDDQRLEYLYLYMRAVLSAVKEHGCNVKTYTIWSLMDNFEWESGYRLKFGLYNVDFSHPNRTRTPKSSVAWLKNVLRLRKLQPITPYLEFLGIF